MGSGLLVVFGSGELAWVRRHHRHSAELHVRSDKKGYDRILDDDANRRSSHFSTHKGRSDKNIFFKQRDVFGSNIKESTI